MPSTKDLIVKPLRPNPEKNHKYEEEIKKKYNHEVLPNLPFHLLLVAPTGSGKTVVLNNILYQFYKDVFDEIHYISPTIAIDEDSGYIIAEDPNIHKYTSDAEMNHINSIYQGIVDQQKKIRNQDRKHILVIFDDCIDYLTNGCYIDKMSTKDRHYKISTIVATQVLKGCPCRMRTQCTDMVVFRTFDEEERKKIKESAEGKFASFDILFDVATDAKNDKDIYNFLYLNKRKSRAYRNFQTLIWHPTMYKDMD